MLVVSDTSPINYLILIGHIDLLPRLFGRIVIPTAVLNELGRQESPEAVKAWLKSPPDWLEVGAPRVARDPRLDDLDAGEREAILLTREYGADALLADDYAAFTIARKEGIDVIRTLTILRRAANEGLIDLPQAVSLLLKTNFRIQKSVIEEVLGDEKAL